MFTKTNIQARPFLKWAGGKGQLINQIKEFLPSEIVASKKIDKYFEPFLGGGAVFFWLSKEYQIKKSHLYDINPEIVSAFQTVRDSAGQLISKLKKLQNDYISLSKLNREKFYYDCREDYNKLLKSNKPIDKTALLIFLNKTGFNGLFRVNSQGQFNVPFGRYENPTICDGANLLAVSEILENAEIECKDFGHCLGKADKNSLFYFDPPYRPISKTASFTGYIKDGFNDQDQRRLKEICDKLTKKGAKVILSNSDPKNINVDDNFFDDLFGRNYKIERLQATRMINCNSEKRGIIKEILVMNY
jgi:DNA adenine methylase